MARGCLPDPQLHRAELGREFRLLEAVREIDADAFGHRRLSDLRARVEVGKDLVVSPARLRQPVGAPLRQSEPVPPTRAEEGERAGSSSLARRGHDRSHGHYQREETYASHRVWVLRWGNRTVPHRSSPTVSLPV